MAYKNPYPITDGDTDIQFEGDYAQTNVGMQLVTDAAYNGTTATARLKQSNDPDLPAANWNLLPEAPIVLNGGAIGVGSTLLQTKSFVMKHLMITITVGDALAGNIAITDSIKS